MAERAANVPTLRRERALMREGYRYVAGMDEVGRGALAGPVSVGVCVVDLTTGTAPVGVKDSKLVPEAKRPDLARRVKRWSMASSVGHTAPSEIDALGMTAALRLAGNRALSALSVQPDVVILDGKHDWLTNPESAGLLGLLDPEQADGPRVVTQIKADLRCSSVAGASLVAKVERDAILTELAWEYPQYGWDVNKGYSAPHHLQAIATYGACDAHRRSWKTFANTSTQA